jgi:ankyrin repeat protein
VIDELLRLVAAWRLGAVRDRLRAVPGLVNALGPHPYWGGRPQPLHVAIEVKRRDMFDLLLEHGADPSGTNHEYDQWSPVMIAIHHDQSGMRDELLRRGARIGLAEALLLADDERVKALLAAEGLPRVVPNRGSFLAFARTPRAIDRLLRVGASIDAPDRWGMTPAAAISRLGQDGRALVRRLVERGAKPTPADYARLGDRDALRHVSIADPDAVRGDDVVVAAAESGHHGLVRWLLDQGGNAGARASGGSRQTALHAAAWNGDLAMATLLVAAGADPTARDQQYDATPRGWAETSTAVTNNPACAAVAAYLATLDRD